MQKSSIAVLAGVVVLAIGASQAAAPTLPRQKPGLWQQSIARDGKTNPAMSSQICLDPAVEAKMTAMGTQISKQHCQAGPLTHNLDGSWTMTSTCSFGGPFKAASTARVTGDFNSKIVTTISSTNTGSPVPAMNGTHQTVVTALWLGPCKPGQTGGDIVMANGMRMNVLTSTPAPQSSPH